MTDKPSPKIEWDDLIRTFEDLNGKEYKVVKRAEGIAPWGQKIIAELHISEFDERSILVSLPEQGGRNLAILNGRTWEIWVTHKDEIHIVQPTPQSPTGFPPDEYLWLTGE